MSRRPVAGRRLPHRLVQPAVEKSLPLALASAGGQIRSGDAALMALRQQSALRGQLAVPLPRDDYPYEFGPSIPLNPSPLDPTGLSGRAEPRLYEYPVSWNLPGQDNRLIPWRTLRQAGDHPLIRSAITVRKAEVAGLEWDFKLARRAVDEAMQDAPGTSRLEIEGKLREQLRPAIQAARAAWSKPDVGNGLTFAEWTSRFLEEHLVLDAAVIYPRLTVGGQWFSFEILDGATVKPLLDHRGGRPLPPQPAYQQILYGFPRGEFTADTSDMDGQLQIPNAYRSDQLIYIQRESRVASPYGLSPVERCLIDLSLWMKRQEWLRDEYDEAVQPAGWFINEQVGDAWTPSQVLEYEREFNDLHQGNTAARMRYRMLPPGIKPAESGSHDFAEKFKPEFDLHLLKLVLMHFDVTIHELGFTETKGLGSAGYAEGQDRINDRKGRLPTLRWMASLFTDISRAHLAVPAELEFTWLGLDDDEVGVEEIPVTERLASAMLTLNESRDEEGMTRYSFPEADKPFIVTGTGQVVFIEGVEQKQDELAAAEAEAQSAQLQALKDKPAAGDPAKKAEAKAYRKWAQQERVRPFVAKALRPDDADTYGLDVTRIEFSEVADLGKARWPAWAWSRDEQVAQYWAPRITAALLGAVNVEELAQAWLAAEAGREAVKGLGEVARRARAWLAGKLDLVNPFTRVIEQIQADAFEVGAAAAAETLGEAQSSYWDNWEPGHPLAGKHAAALQDLLNDTGITIKSVTAHRFDDLAEALSDGIAAGDNAATIAKAIRGILSNPAMAHTIAVTETARAVSRAALERYVAAGLKAAEWAIAPDSRVCVICEGNAAQGPVRLGQRFASGDRHPPGHPRCRCALVPHLD